MWYLDIFSSLQLPDSASAFRLQVSDCITLRVDAAPSVIKVMIIMGLSLFSLCEQCSVTGIAIFDLTSICVYIKCFVTDLGCSLWPRLINHVVCGLHKQICSNSAFPWNQLSATNHVWPQRLSYLFTIKGKCFDSAACHSEVTYFFTLHSGSNNETQTFVCAITGIFFLSISSINL